MENRQPDCLPATKGTFLPLFFLLGLLLMVPEWGSAQVTVNEDALPSEMVKAFANQRNVRTRKALLKGNPQASGTFESPDGIPMFDGVILSTGKASDLAGPNSTSEISTYNERNGDKDLSYLAGIKTFDAASLEFEFQPAKDSISFRFIYASESYSERLNSTYDDPVVITLSGPGIKGVENLAVIPGSKTPIHSGTVSLNKNKRYYVDNNPFYLNGTLNEKRQAELDPELLKTIQYDGMTQVMEVGCRVKPRAIYRIRITIADAGDGNSDSAILLGGSSLESQEQLWRIRKRERMAFVKDSLYQDSIWRAAVEAQRIADSLAAVAEERRQDSLRNIAEEPDLDGMGNTDSGQEASEDEILNAGSDPGQEEEDDFGDGGDFGDYGGGSGDDSPKGGTVHAPFQQDTPHQEVKQSTIQGSQPKAGTGGMNGGEVRPTPRPNSALYRKVPSQRVEEGKLMLFYQGEDYFGTEEDDQMVNRLAQYLKANSDQKVGLYTPDGSSNADLRYDILRTDLIRAGVEPNRIFRNGFSFLSGAELEMYHQERIELWVR